MKSLRPLLLFGPGLVHGMAQPSCTTAVCQFDNPTATPSVTSYPTTLTFASSWSTVRTTQDDGSPGTTTEIQHVVTIEPHAASPTSFPATIVQSVTTTHTFVWAVGARTTTSTAVEPTSSQWIVYQPGATDLPRHSLGQDAAANGTTNGTTNGTAPAEQCAAAEQQTACVRQCAQRDGLWYCFDKHAWYEENVMGRVCWWTQPDDAGDGSMVTQYLMLAEPCRVGDPHLDCEACRLYG